MYVSYETNFFHVFVKSFGDTSDMPMKHVPQAFMLRFDRKTAFDHIGLMDLFSGLNTLDKKVSRLVCSVDHLCKLVSIDASIQSTIAKNLYDCGLSFLDDTQKSQVEEHSINVLPGIIVKEDEFIEMEVIRNSIQYKGQIGGVAPVFTSMYIRTRFLLEKFLNKKLQLDDSENMKLCGAFA